MVRSQAHTPRSPRIFEERIAAAVKHRFCLGVRRAPSAVGDRPLPTVLSSMSLETIKPTETVCSPRIARNVRTNGSRRDPGTRASQSGSAWSPVYLLDDPSGHAKATSVIASERRPQPGALRLFDERSQRRELAVDVTEQLGLDQAREVKPRTEPFDRDDMLAISRSCGDRRKKRRGRIGGILGGS